MESLTGGIKGVEEVDKYALGGFRAKVEFRFFA